MLLFEGECTNIEETHSLKERLLSLSVSLNLTLDRNDEVNVI